MEGLAAIWSDVDRLLNKPAIRKSINTHLCTECNGVKVFKLIRVLLINLIKCHCNGAMLSIL